MNKLIMYTTLVLLLASCNSSNRKPLTNDSNYLDEYIKKLENTDKITNEPLVVIDGYTIIFSELKSSDININKSDIRQIDYIEKESETAISLYGQRAAGGVLLITTNGVPIKLKKPENVQEILYLIDNKEASENEFLELNPESLDSLEVIKDTSIIKEYTSKDYKEIIKVTLKKDTIR